MNDKQSNKASKKQSRSRSFSEPRRRNKFKNPYINFLRDFKSTTRANLRPPGELFRLAGEKWRTMSDAEKEPYINAAKEAKNKPPKKSKERPEKKDLNKEGKADSKNTHVSKMNLKKCCSKCGHRHGSPLAPEDCHLPLRQRRVTTRRYSRRDQETDETSRSRSRSAEGSPNESPSDSSASRS